MSQTTYQVILSADGKHRVIVTTDNRGETNLALAWAKATYAKLMRGEDAPGEQPEDLAGLVDRELGAEPPECAAHHTPMVWVEKGKRGPFWSCRQKNADGSWCSFTRQPGELGCQGPGRLPEAMRLSKVSRARSSPAAPGPLTGRSSRPEDSGTAEPARRASDRTSATAPRPRRSPRSRPFG